MCEFRTCARGGARHLQGMGPWSGCMSKRRAIIAAVTIKGVSQAEAARRYGVSESTVSRVLARYRAEGGTAFEPRSRRPHSNPNRVAGVVNNLIVNLRDQLTAQGLDAGPETIRLHLEHHHQVTVSVSTIRRRLITAGRITPEPRKRPRSSYVRFEADLPNETWQTDVTYYWLGPRRQDQTNRVEILTWLDDHSRYALSVTAHQPVLGSTVVETLQNTGQTHGFPASILSDNALYDTTRFAGGRGSTSESSTPPPVSSSVASPSTPTTTTSPKTQETRTTEGSGLADVARHHRSGEGGI